MRQSATKLLSNKGKKDSFTAVYEKNTCTLIITIAF